MICANENNNYWRKIYKNKWKDGADRVKTIQGLINEKHPEYKIKNGFMSLSTQMLLDTPADHEKGSPDFAVFNDDKLLYYVEVTGSNITIGDNALWLRPDKVKWALNHKEFKTFVFFVYNDKIFFIQVTSFLLDMPIKTKNLKGVLEKYFVIPQEYAHIVEKKNSNI